MGASFSGPFAKLKNLRRNVSELANAAGRTQHAIATEVAKEVKQLIREQFRDGEGPFGPWARRADGERALVSRRLPSDFEARVRPGARLWVQPSRARWLRAHHEGHTFAPRAAAGQLLTFDKRGRLISKKRQRRAKFVFDTKARSHTVGRRELPARPIYPTSAASSRTWASRVTLGQQRAMARWSKGVLK
jgi:hypothetical protein